MSNIDANRLAEDIEMHLAWCDKFTNTVSSVIIRNLLTVIAKQRNVLAMFKDYKFGDGDVTYAINDAITLSAPLVKLIEKEDA